MSVKSEIASGDWGDYYRSYQGSLAERYLIPVLERWGVVLRGRRFLEVGCGDGGCGAAFHRAGCRVFMLDVDERLVATAKKANDAEGIDIPTFVGDALDPEATFYSHGPFDIVLFRDVMEHLEDPVEALKIAKQHLSQEGVVFVVFPPYYSPYGAHQQILPRKTIAGIPYNKLPFLQLLPKSWFLPIVAGDAASNKEVARLSDVRLTIGGFERSVRAAGLRIRERNTYLSRPTFALRYGLPVVPAGFLGRIPLLRELWVTAAYYLLSSR
jgi:2-polyprenyl-3-methyl-5-hydroxy-6-metoxy-1,4-benzoquinol methylase